MTITDDSEDIGIGNRLNRMLHNAINAVFVQGELAQLSHTAFDEAVTKINSENREKYELTYPVGYKPTKEPIVGTLTYKKDDLISRYVYLAHTQVPANGIYQLAMIMEILFSELIRTVVLEYPQKIGSKRQIQIKDVLASNSIEELRVVATDSLLNELSYKSPKDFAEEARGLLSVNLLECPAYHVYIEMKATRDVFIHNGGIANQIYLTKAGSHARVKVGQSLPISQPYFLEVYEACLQLMEWLEEELHRTWHSSEYLERKQQSGDSV